MEISKKIEEITGIDTAVTILGYIQRGGSPTVRDRVAASLMGAKATECLANGIYNRIIAERDDEVVSFDLNEALAMTKTIDEKMVETSKILAL